MLRVEAGAALVEVEVVGHDRLGAAHIALGVREQAAADLVRVAALRRTAVVENQEGVRNAVALLDREVAVLRGGARFAVDADLEAVRDVGDDRVGVGLERGRLLRAVAVLERGVALLEERIVAFGVGSRDDQQVVLQAELHADVSLPGGGGVGVHHGAEAVGERGHGHQQQDADRGARRDDRTGSMLKAMSHGRRRILYAAGGRTRKRCVNERLPGPAEAAQCPRTAPLSRRTISLRSRRAYAIFVTVATAMLAGGCASGDDWSTPHAKPVAVGTLGAGFIDPTAPPTPESTITPRPGSWDAVHPPKDYRVVLLTAGDDAPDEDARRSGDPLGRTGARKPQDPHRHPPRPVHPAHRHGHRPRARSDRLGRQRPRRSAGPCDREPPRPAVSRHRRRRWPSPPGT